MSVYVNAYQSIKLSVIYIYLKSLKGHNGKNGRNLDGFCKI